MRRTLVPARVILQIELVIGLRIPPLAGGQDLSRDVSALPPLLLRLVRHIARLALLLVGVVEDGGAVLRAGVHALPVLGRGVVHLVEELQQRAVRQLRGVESHLQRLGVYGHPGFIN